MSEQKSGNSLKTYLLASIPLVIFAALAATFYSQLKSGNNAQDLPSVLIDKVAPGFPSEPLQGLMRDGVQVPAISAENTKGKLLVVNVWASWCVPCRQEHPVLARLAKMRKDIMLVGINYKDKNENALRFLGALGNPYAAVSVDPKGVASIDWGVYGIPETYIVDRTGKITLKHVGPISNEILDNKIIPAIDAAMNNGNQAPDS